jgi:beta-phosphoglucomutase
MTVRALLLDFNGTLSEDEPLLFAIFEDLFASAGKPITEADYYDQLAGLSDPEVVEAWLGKPEPALVARKIQLYLEGSADGHTISLDARQAVREAAEHVVVAIVSGSARREIEPVVAAAGLSSSIAELVAAEDVEHGKPAPDGYLQMLELLGLEPGEAVALEDSEVGIAAAKAAGLSCYAVSGTHPADRLAAADGIVERLDPDFVRRVLA